MMTRRFILYLCAALCVFRVTAAEQPPNANACLRITVGIAPLRECVEAVGGPLVSVHVLMPRGANPETFALTPRTIATLGKSDLYIAIGVPFESSLREKFARSFPAMQILDGTRGMTFLELHGHHHHAADEHDDAATEHPSRDPHVWLDIDNMACLARTVAAELTRRFPSETDAIALRLNQYTHDLNQLDEQIRTRLAARPSKDVLVFHPAFGYFLAHYGLTQHAVELDGKEPTGTHLAALTRDMQHLHCTRLYIQPQFSKKTAAVLARKLQATIVELDPLPEHYSQGLLLLAEKLME